MKNYLITVKLETGEVFTEERSASSRGELYKLALLQANDKDAITSIEVTEVAVDLKTLEVLVREHKGYSGNADKYYAEHNLDRYHEENDKARAIKDVALKMYSKKQWMAMQLKLRKVR